MNMNTKTKKKVTSGLSKRFWPVASYETRIAPETVSFVRFANRPGCVLYVSWIGAQQKVVLPGKPDYLVYRTKEWGNANFVTIAPGANNY